MNRGGFGGFGFVLWMQNELPLSLIEKQGEGEIGADESDDNDGGDGLHKPGMTDRWLRGGPRGSFGGLWEAGHV